MQCKRSRLALLFGLAFLLQTVMPLVPVIQAPFVSVASAADPECSDRSDNDRDGQVDFYDSDCYKDGVYDKTRNESAPTQQETSPASTVFMMTINGSHNNARIYPGQPVTVTWSAPAGYNYCNTGVSPPQPGGWGSYVNKNPSGSEVWWPTVASMRFQLQCAVSYPGPMVIEDGVASDWIYQCSDGIDNDGDGAIDTNDFSCSSPTDNDETNPKAQCQDGIDNDTDGLVDFPQDPGCSSTQDNSETNAPPPATTGCIRITKQALNAAGAPITPVPGFTFILDGNASLNATSDVNGIATLSNVAAPGVHTVSENSQSGWSFLNPLSGSSQVMVQPGTSCATLTFVNQQQGAAPTPQCQDGIDNDGDGATDFPSDFSCSSATDNDETNPKAACQDGINNDGDAFTDFPQDPGCSGNQDNDEFNAVAAQCRSEVHQGVLANNCASPVGNGLCGSAFYKDITFSQPYAAAPNVLVTINHITEGPACAGGATDKALCYPSNITATGFRLHCGGSPVSDGCGAGTNGYWTMATANWTAVEKDAACKAQSDHGIVPQNCSNNQGGLCASGPFTQQITFTTPFAAAPNVLVAAENVSNQGGCVGGATDQIHCFPSNITAAGFMLNCSGSPFQSCSTSEGFASLATAGWLAQESTNQCKVQSQHLLQTSECPTGVVSGTCASGFRKTVTFPQAFSAPPKVIVSPELITDSSGVSACAQGATDAYKCEAQSITTTGFVAVCWGSPEGNECGAAQNGHTTSAKFGYMAVDSACSQGGPPPPAAQCADGIDNDGDGATDFPSDFSCSSATDNDETNPKAACQDGINNDGDAFTDFPQDPGCSGNQDNDETNSISGSADLSMTLTVDPQIHRGQNLLVKLLVKNEGTFTVPNATATQAIPTGLTFFSGSGCSSNGVTLTCNVSTLTSGQTIQFNVVYTVSDSLSCNTTVPLQATVTTTSMVDSNPSNNSSSGSVLVTCPGGPPSTQCSDGADNDDDGAVDSADFSCSSPTDTDETNPKSQCQDGINNDGDGFTDFPQDPGCSSNQDNDETNACMMAKIVYIDLQPNPPLIPSEYQGLNNAGYNVAFYNRNSLPVITSGVLNRNNYDAAYFHNGCGGATGLLTSGELTVIRDFYLAGGHLSLTADDAIGDSGHGQQRVGNCTARVNQIAANLGLQFGGTLNNAAGGSCQAVTTSHPIFTGEKVVGRNTDAQITFTNSVSWGGTLPSSIAILTSTAQVAVAYTPAVNGHGSVVFNTNETGLVSCGLKKTENYISLLGLSKSCGQPPSAQCQDGLDNDADGFTDMNDFSCSSPTDNDETNPKSACQDGIDSDGDGLVDANDPGCTSSQDNDETNTPPPPATMGCIRITKQALNAAGAPITPVPGFTFILDGNASLNAVSDANGIATLSNVAAPGEHTITETPQSGWTLIGSNPTNGKVMVQPGFTCATITFTNQQGVPSTQCSDGIDNDGDGAVDSADFSCSSPTDNDETNPKSQCQDGIDNDGDGLNDAQDPGCVNIQDNDETNPSTADLVSTKSGPASVNRGSVVRYTVTATNQGPGVGTNVVIGDIFPAPLVFGDFNPAESSADCALNGNKTSVLCNNFSLQNGASKSFTIAFTIPMTVSCGTILHNQSTVSASSTDPVSSNNISATVDTVVDCPATTDLIASLSLDPQINKNDKLPVSVSIQNAGATAVSSSLLTIPIPAGFTFDSSVPSLCSAGGGNVTCSIGNLTSGQVLPIIAYFIISPTQTCGSTVTMQDTVSTSVATDTNAGNNMGSDSIVVTCP